jgi:hypothetical protein
LATPTEDLVTAILGSLMILGAATDGWAHLNKLSDIQAEGFFTPYHGLLYSGFAATAGWTFWLAYRRRHDHPRWWVDGWPAGYRIGALGVMIFFVAGFLDMIWHTVFGVEASIRALLSPSHLLLTTGSALLLTSPLRSWWAAGDGGRRAFAGAVSLGLGTTAIAVFVSYATAWDEIQPVLPYGEELGSALHTAAEHGVGSYLVATALVVVPLLMSHRRRATWGVGTAVVAWVALFPVFTHEFARPQSSAAFAAIGAAAIADWILVQLDRRRGMDAPLRLPIAGAVFAGLVVAAHLAALHLDRGIQWPPELWTGTIFSAAGVGALLGGLAAPPWRSPVGQHPTQEGQALTDHPADA